MGWFVRVFTYGFLRPEKALMIGTTLFSEEDYQAGLREPLTRVIDDFGLRYPGVKTVEHVYFCRVGVVDEGSGRECLKRARALGQDFSRPSETGSAAA